MIRCQPLHLHLLRRRRTSILLLTGLSLILYLFGSQLLSQSSTRVDVVSPSDIVTVAVIKLQQSSSSSGSVSAKRAKYSSTTSIRQQRRAIQREMNGYKFFVSGKGKSLTLDNLILEKGGQPIRNVVFSTWRSGSTFLGQTLEMHPGTFYHYEPFMHFGIKQVRYGDDLAKEGLRVLNQLLNCNFTDLNDYIDYGKRHPLFRYNTRVWQYCRKSPHLCSDTKFLSEMCKLFPFQSVKTVRMRIRLANTFLENKELNIRLLLLVRDPRGTMQSRNQRRDWCPQHPDCYDPKNLCMDMVEDFKFAEKLRLQYPDRFLVIRYEDMSLFPYASMQKIFHFFRLQYHPQVEKFLKSHTNKHVGGVWSTYRDSRGTPFHWRKDFIGNFSQVTDIQNSCKAAMKLWGYNSVSDQDHLLSFNPLGRPPWQEMLVLNCTNATALKA